MPVNAALDVLRRGNTGVAGGRPMGPPRAINSLAQPTRASGMTAQSRIAPAAGRNTGVAGPAASGSSPYGPGYTQPGGPGTDYQPTTDTLIDTQRRQNDLAEERARGQDIAERNQPPSYRPLPSPPQYGGPAGQVDQSRMDEREARATDYAREDALYGRRRDDARADDAQAYERGMGLFRELTGRGAQPVNTMAGSPAGGPTRMGAPRLGPMTIGPDGTAGHQGAPGGGGQPSASDLAFARAKDREGLIHSASVRDLRSNSTNMGTAGSGDERRAMAALAGRTGGNLMDVSTTQALAEAQRGADVEDRNYAGDLSRRGQDFGLAPSILALMRGGRTAY